MAQTESILTFTHIAPRTHIQSPKDLSLQAYEVEGYLLDVDRLKTSANRTKRRYGRRMVLFTP